MSSYNEFCLSRKRRFHSGSTVPAATDLSVIVGCFAFPRTLCEWEHSVSSLCGLTSLLTLEAPLSLCGIWSWFLPSGLCRSPLSPSRAQLDSRGGRMGWNSKTASVWENGYHRTAGVLWKSYLQGSSYLTQLEGHPVFPNGPLLKKYFEVA